MGFRVQDEKRCPGWRSRSGHAWCGRGSDSARYHFVDDALQPRDGEATYLPRGPDMWMLSAKGVASGDFSESWSFFPSIPTLLKRWQVRSAVYIREATTRHQRGPPIRWACIASSKPIPVPPGQLEQMRNMLQTLNPRQERKALGLLQKLHEAHILEPAEQETVMCCT